MNTIIYVGNFSFPFGNAAGKRVYGNGKLLRELGYKVEFVGLERELDDKTRLIDTKKVYDEFEYYNFPYPRKTKDWMRYKKYFNRLKEFIEKKKRYEKIEYIVLYGSPSLSLFNSLVIKYCKKENIKVIADCVDWLSTKTNNLLFDFVKWADNTYQKAYSNKKADGVITISEYLNEYYKKANKKTVTLPPLSCEEKNQFEYNYRSPISFLYAGIPFRKGKVVRDLSTLKDRIDKTIEIFHEVHKKGHDFKFDIYGFTEKDYIEINPSQKDIIKTLGNKISFNGNQNNELIVEKVKKTDFTILLREVNRDTTAGFPTKVSESIGCGTPVITTKTSDINKYIEDNKNGFILKDTEDINKMCEIMKLNKNDIETMKKNCIDENVFYYKKYISEVNSFLKEL